MAYVALDRDQWTQAALDAVERDGVAAVAVEPLTRALGVTKGSFYWHFSGRDELLRAALERWLERSVRDPIRALAHEPDPRKRLAGLFGRAGAKPGSIFIRLLDAATDPVVGDVVRTAAEERVAFMTQALRELGRTPAKARKDATLAYAAYVGVVHLQRDAPDVLGDRQAFNRHLAQRLMD